MWRDTPIPVALTIDDAPSVYEPGGPAFDPGRMDRIRDALLNAGIRHCVAFVIGSRARGHEGCLRRWLEAGFELGNHTEDHLAASAVEPDRFVESTRACHQLLLELGAFDGGRRRYFRHPFGDRGIVGARRRGIAAAIAQLGYSPAEVTMDLYDYAYDRPWAQAVGQPAPRTAQIEARWVRVAARSIGRCGARGRRLWGPELIHVAVCHFGPVTERGFQRLATEVGAQVRWSSLADALDVSRYQRLISDMEREGIPAELLSRRLADRALRRAARVLEPRSSLGPRWPHLTL